ncbi:MAG: PEP-CTERM sorting domain-containing protein [Phycisphaerae bacterium]|jgi:probable HAF family extracellular repeat protein
MKRTCFVAIVTAAFVMSGGALADVWFTGTGYLEGGEAATAGDVSADGSVVAGSTWRFDTQEAFRWTAATGPVSLGFLPAVNPCSIAYGVSGDGQTLVGCANSGSLYHGFRWTEAEGMVSLGHLPGGAISTAWNASADGSVIVGIADTGSMLDLHGFRWTADTGMVALPSLPGGLDTYSDASGVSADGAIIVGSSSSVQGTRACRWVDGDVSDLGLLPGGNTTDGSFADNISADGSVIVGASSSASTAAGYYETFRWTADDGMVGLGDLPGGIFHSQASDVSADGSIIVGMANSDGVTSPDGFEAFIWDADNGMRSLRDVLTTKLGLDLTGWTLLSATGISADGCTIVGNGFDSSGMTQGWVAHIPEPATSALLLLGLTLAARRRRR